MTHTPMIQLPFLYRICSLCGALLVLMTMAGCAPSRTVVTYNRDIELPQRESFRMSYEIVDPDGKPITREIFEDDIDTWFIFSEFCKEFEEQLRERGYRFVFDPGAPADFIVQIGFSAFYSPTATRERVREQPFATLMVGRVWEGEITQYEHVVAMEALARAPGLDADDFVVYWRARTYRIGEDRDVRFYGLDMIEEIVSRFPPPQRRRR